MASRREEILSGFLQKLARPTTLSDAVLIDRFARHRDEAAFELLVKRYGPLVWRVSRRLVRDENDADDVFQATFLLLARKPQSLKNRNALGPWLHSVAVHLAQRAIRSAARRKHHEHQAGLAAQAGKQPDQSVAELVSLLDEELARIADKFRVPLVLCYLEGKTQAEASRQLGIPQRTVCRRLEQGMELLRQRVKTRGFELPSALVFGVLAGPTEAGVPTLLFADTVRNALASGVASARAAALTEGVLKSMLLTKVKIGTTVLLFLSILGGGLLVPLALSETGAKSKPAAGQGTAAHQPGEGSNGRTEPAPAQEHKDREGFALPAEALARVGSARLRHGRSLSNLVYSPDGKWLASFGGGIVRLWDAASGSLERSIPVAEGSGIREEDVVFAADAATVLVLDGDGCRWFDVRTGAEVHRCEIKIPKTNSCARFAPHGDAIVVADTDRGKDLVVYDLPSGRERFRKTAKKSWHWHLAFTPDGRMLAAMDLDWVGSDPQIRFFDVTTGQSLGGFNAGKQPRFCLSPDGKKLLSHDFAKSVRVWSVPDGALLHEVQADVNALVRASFSPDGRSIVFGTQDLDALQIDLATGKALHRYRTWPSSIGIAFTPHGQNLALGIGEGLITQWDLATGNRLSASAGTPGYAHLQFDRNQNLLWASSPTAFAAVDWKTGQEVRCLRLPSEALTWHWQLSVSPDRSRVVGSDTGKRRTVWDSSSGKVVSVLPQWAENPCVLSPKGDRLYATHWDGPIRGWDLGTAKELPAIDTQNRVVHALGISPDGRWLAAADHPQAGRPKPRREVTVWDLSTGREVRRLMPRQENERTWGLAFGPNSALLVAAGGVPYPSPGQKQTGFIMAWDVRSGAERFFRNDLPSQVRTVAFSSDGRLLATGSTDGAVRLWELATGQERHRFTGHESVVADLAFSQDARLLAASSADAPILIWDVTGCYGQPASTTPFTRQEVDRLWKSLASADAALTFKAMRQLFARPGPAATLLAGRLHPVASVDATVIEQHLHALDADDFNAREKAASELMKVADQVEPQLRKALQGAPSAEAERRLKALLDTIEKPPLERVRELRAVEVLERIGTPAARKCLAELAGGAKDARLTRDAAATIGRMRFREAKAR